MRIETNGDGAVVGFIAGLFGYPVFEGYIIGFTVAGFSIADVV